MVLAGTVPCGLVAVPPMPSAPFANEFPDKEGDDDYRTNSQQVRVSVREQGMKENAHSPVLKRTAIQNA
jgi:hypothetical protein